MKKLLSLYPVVGLVMLLAFNITSCKKPVHSLRPSPNNIRLLGYSATTQRYTIGAIDTNTDNYSFFYDAIGRVSTIIYSSSDPAVINKLPAGQNNEKMSFYYGNDTCIKTTTDLNGIK